MSRTDLAITATRNETDEARISVQSLLIEAHSSTAIFSLSTKINPERPVITVSKSYIPMNDQLQADLPMDDSAEVQPKYSTFDDNVHYNEQDKIGTTPGTSKMKLHIRVHFPPPPNAGTAMLDPRVQKAVEYREHENAMSRKSTKNHREIIESITTKSLENIKEHDFNVFASYATIQKRKNNRSRERSLEKKLEKERIMAKPIANKRLLERKFLKNAIETTRHKIEGDRRKKYKKEKVNESNHNGNAQSPSCQVPSSWSASKDKAIAAIWPPHQEVFYQRTGMVKEYSMMKKFDVNYDGMNTGLIMNAAAAPWVFPLPYYQHLTSSSTTLQVPGGETGSQRNTTACFAEVVTNPHCPIPNIPCLRGLLQNRPLYCFISGHHHKFGVCCPESGAADMSPTQLSYESPQGIASLPCQPNCHDIGFSTTGGGADGHYIHHQPSFNLGSTMTPWTLILPWWPLAGDHRQSMDLLPPSPSPSLALTNTSALNDGVIINQPNGMMPVMQGSQEECHDNQRPACIDSFGAAGTELQQELLLTYNPLATSGMTITVGQHGIISPFILMNGSHESKLNAIIEGRSDADEFAPLLHSFIVYDHDDETTVDTFEWFD